MVLNFAGYSAIERRRNVDASLKMIEAAWAKEPQNPSITDSLGWAYVLTGRIDEAVPLLEQAQRGEPDNAVILAHIADSSCQTRRRFSTRNAIRAVVLLPIAYSPTHYENNIHHDQ